MSDDQWYQIILMLIYTGVRISELLNLKKENIDFDSQCFDVINSKTENGIRKVPIADCILPFFKGWYEFSTCDYLLCTLDKKPLTYRNYFDSYWQPLLEQIDMTRYTPHCTRHTCISSWLITFVFPLSTSGAITTKSSFGFTSDFRRSASKSSIV